jgi:hypothetical protein
MTQTKANRPKRGRGRPKTGVGTLIGARWHDAELAAIDEWRRKEHDIPGRAEAVRRLVRLGLTMGRSK